MDIVLIAAVAIGSFVAFKPFSSQASPAQTRQNPLDAAAKAHDLHSPLSDHQRALTQEALKLKAQGKVNGNVVRVGHGKRGYVQLAREGESPVWSLIGEFGTDTRAPYGGTAGPLHNQIPQPNRANDNTTIWQADFNQQHYNDILFGSGRNANSMRTYHLEQSSNRYTVHGIVENWVQVEVPAGLPDAGKHYNEAR
jgi:immune inhibitor A